MHTKFWQWITLFGLVAAGAIAPAGERMSPGEMAEKSEDERMAWAIRRLGPYQTALYEAAKRNRVPPRLLATVILNELSDYKMEDIIQETVYSTIWTIGYGQTSVKKVLERDEMRGLISESEIAGMIEQIKQRMPRSGARREIVADPPADRDYRRMAIERLTWQKLNNPAIAIEVAAREIARLMGRMSANPRGPWARHFLKGPFFNNPYASVKPAYYSCAWNAESGIADWERQCEKQGTLQLNREISLTIAVVAAYNSDKIIDANVSHQSVFGAAADGAEFLNARIHADNAVMLWARLLYQRKWSPQAPVTTKEGVKYYLEYYFKEPRTLKTCVRGGRQQAEADMALIKRFADGVRISPGPNNTFRIIGKAWMISGTGSGYASPNDPKLLADKASREKDGHPTRITTTPNWSMFILDQSGGMISKRHLPPEK